MPACVNVTHNHLHCLEAGLAERDWCPTCKKDPMLHLRYEYQQKMRYAEGRVADGSLSQRDCDLCGEPLDEEIGEFYDPGNPDTHVIAHAQCGLDHRLEIA